MAMQAPEDPVAGRSGFLCTYMSQHPETLLAYVFHHEKGSAIQDAKNPRMASISTREMVIEYTLAGSKRQSKVGLLSQADVISFLWKIPFHPPLAGYDEVRPRLVAMKHEAEEGVGMVSF
jgi:hypothetical protein